MASPRGTPTPAPIAASRCVNDVLWGADVLSWDVDEVVAAVCTAEPSEVAAAEELAEGFIVPKCCRAAFPAMALA